jgi:hypothetical protein
MTIVADAPADPLTEWLLHVRPVGLVIGPNILREEELVPPRQSAVDTEAVRLVLSEDVDDDASILPDPWAFFSSVLGWDARFVAGATSGPELPDSLAVKGACDRWRSCGRQRVPCAAVSANGRLSGEKSMSAARHAPASA